MLFFKKEKRPPPLTPQEIVEAVFGSNTTVTTSFRCHTSEKFPFLSRWGSHAEAGYFVNGEYGELVFEFSIPLKIFDTERDYKFHHYGFVGSCLTLRHPFPSLRNTYAFSGKPFRKPDDETWVYNDKTKGVSIWSEYAQLSAEEMATVEKFISWIEGGMSAMVSARYALFCKRDTISVVFWEPAFYHFESQLDMLHDFLQVLS